MRPVLRLKGYAAIDGHRNAVEARASLEMHTRPTDVECKIAVAQVPVHRGPGDCRTSQGRLNSILDIVELQISQQWKPKTEVDFASSRDMRRIDSDIMCVAQRLGVDDLEDIADRPGQGGVEGLPFPPCA